MKGKKSDAGGVLYKAWKDPKLKFVRWSIWLMIGLTVFADFIANDKPLYYRTEERAGFPVIKHMFSRLHLAQWTVQDASIDWRKMEADVIVFPPVPYNPSETDMSNAGFKGPFDTQSMKGRRFRHWLGTDQLGRDVLSGLVHGTRIAFLVGVLSMLLAALIGIPVGAYAGYFGDRRLKLPIAGVVSGAVFVALALYFFVLSFEIQAALTGAIILCALGGLVIFLIIRIWPDAKHVTIPIDTLVIRSIEVIRSIPAFFLMFAILGMVEIPGLHDVILLIAFLWSPSIVRFVRAEALRLQEQTFIQSARVLGLTDTKIVMRHILPNAIGPALITISFGIGTAVLIESGLSFLGIGIAPETMTWGKMLNAARSNFSAWWLALLPGLAIFLTIATFNRFGEVLETKLMGR